MQEPSLSESARTTNPSKLVSSEQDRLSNSTLTYLLASAQGGIFFSDMLLWSLRKRRHSQHADGIQM